MTDATEHVLVQILLPLSLSQGFDYLVPDGMTLAPGDFVRVPLGRKVVTGVVWKTGQADTIAKPPPPPARTDQRQPELGFDLPPRTPPHRHKKIRYKQVLTRLDLPPLPPVLLRFVDWVADYNLAPAGMVLRMMMPGGPAMRVPEPAPGLRFTGQPPPRMTAQRAAFWRWAGQAAGSAGEVPQQIFAKADLMARSGASASVLAGLVTAGVLEPAPLPAPPGPCFDPDHQPPDLNEEQATAATALRQAVRAADYRPVLLHGVTGSGKTEVFFEAVAEALRCGREVLILLPEIALTGQFLTRFAARFGARPAEWHSDLTAAQRRTVWHDVLTGRARVVIGARSALFLPFRALGLIIVDEEHEASYKQDDRVSYQGRDMAIVRAHLTGIPVVLSSATPSLETLINAQTGRFEKLDLTRRHGGARLPAIRAIDLRETPPERGMWLAPPLVAAITEALAAGEQALLYLNRRGYAPLTLCRHCGHRFECPDCSAWLVMHRGRTDTDAVDDTDAVNEFLLPDCKASRGNEENNAPGGSPASRGNEKKDAPGGSPAGGSPAGRPHKTILQCHHCGHREPMPPHCPSCSHEDSFVPCGPGVERIAEEVRQRFPDARLLVLSSDLINNLASLRESLAAIAERRVDVIIGTQLIARGHHFPGLGLVGVVDGDLGLAQTDPRAAERTFQLLQQVTGRAGRERITGTGLIQTYMPEHPVMQALLAGQPEAFYRIEAQQRELGGLPPFGRLAAVLVSAQHLQAAEQRARQLAQRFPSVPGAQLLGPAEAPLFVLRGRYRYRLLVKTSRTINIQALIRDWLARLPERADNKAVRVQIDIDPYNFN